MFENLLDPIFNPLLELGFFWAIFIFSFVLTLLITVVYKYATDQNLMKSLKAEMKTMQKELKVLTKSNPSKAMSHQKKVMEKNMQYMKHSFKPTLYTFIPIIIIFGWLNAHLAYMPIEPGMEFTVSTEFADGTFGEITLETLPELMIISEPNQVVENSQVNWQLSGDEGEYILKFTFGNREFEKDLIITNEKTYATPIMSIKDSPLKQIEIHNQKVKPLGDVSILGWKPGWLGVYIILSLIFSFGLRKLMKIS